MNKLYFYLLYIPLGGFLIFSITPFLKNLAHQKSQKTWNNWLNEKLLAENLKQPCIFCNGLDIFEQTIFSLPKSVKKNLFSFYESNERYYYVSLRCKKCQSEVGRKKLIICK
jgi:hypothetical protein